MDEHNSEHDEHSEVHLPDPSIWPLIVGFAALTAGFALVFWARDRSNSFAGPALGAAVLFILVTIAGWAYEDSRMKRKQEEHTSTREREARFTQVLTFAIPEGRFQEARASGVLQSVDDRDNALRDLAGFQDLRIIASPASAGPSQVLVETTWSNREGLATYEETRQTLLDIIAAHPDDVVPGSVQVFDMEVVRDTKDVAFRFSLGAATAVIGSLLVGGFMVGAGLNLFAKNTAAVAPAASATAAGSPNALTITATDDKFDKATLTATANTKITVTLTNNGTAKHNIHFYDKKDGTTLVTGAGDPNTAVNGGSSGTLTFTTPGPGTYYYQCDFHPTTMFGTFTVTAAPAAGATGGGAPAASGNTVIATDNKFNTDTLTAKAGQPFTVTFKNEGAIMHNLHFYDKKGGTTLAPGAGSDTAFIAGGKSETLTFTVPTAGKYYFQCDLHPDQMFGTFTVT